MKNKFGERLRSLDDEQWEEFMDSVQTERKRRGEDTADDIVETVKILQERIIALEGKKEPAKPVPTKKSWLDEFFS